MRRKDANVEALAKDSLVQWLRDYLERDRFLSELDISKAIRTVAIELHYVFIEFRTNGVKRLSRFDDSSELHLNIPSSHRYKSAVFYIERWIRDFYRSNPHVLEHELMNVLKATYQQLPDLFASLRRRSYPSANRSGIDDRAELETHLSQYFGDVDRDEKNTDGHHVNCQRDLRYTLQWLAEHRFTLDYDLEVQCDCEYYNDLKSFLDFYYEESFYRSMADI